MTIAQESRADVLGRFLRYARVDTQADPASDTVPSSPGQLDLQRILVRELRELGVADATLDRHGYVLATVPRTTDRAVPVIALLAHVDVAFDAPGTGVRPQVVRYAGEVLKLPGDPAIVLDPAVSPRLLEHLGHELVTSDGTTLLGADDKAGVAEIMAAVAHLLAHPDIEHGAIRICFTRDEEIGRGVELLELASLRADAAYTIDGGAAGDIEDETFTAVETSVRFHGHAVHPGAAKGRMVNANKVAADFIARLPRDRLSPETTEGREGFVNPMSSRGQEAEAVVDLNLRDFDRDTLGRHERLVRRLADEAVAAFPGARAEVSSREVYANMREHLAAHPDVVARAQEAVRRAGLEPRTTFVRGGTDGSRLSERGLPTPNLFCGAQDLHSRHEWVCVDDMCAAVATIVHLAAVWGQIGAGGA